MNPAFADACLDLIDNTPDCSTDPVGFCRSLFMKRNYHRLITFVESQENPAQLDVQIHYLFTLSLIKVGKRRDVEVYISSLPADVQENPKLVYAKGLFHLKELDFKSATDAFTRAFLGDTFFIEPLHKLLSHHLLTQAGFEELITRSSIPERHVQFLTDYASVSWIYELEGPDAFEKAQKMLEQNPSSPRSIISFVSACFFNRKKGELFTIAQRLLDKEPESPVSHFAAGCHMAVLGKYDAARTLLWKAIRASPSLAAAWVAFAITHWSEGDSRTALSIVLTAARAFPSLELLQIWAGRLYAMTGENAMALVHFRRCNMTGYVLNEIGCLLLKQKKLREAVTILQRSVESPDVCSAYKINYATALRKLGEFDNAVEVLEEVISNEPENVEALSGLAFNYHMLMRIDDAIEIYNRVIGIQPGNSFVRGMLDDAVERVASEPPLL